MKHTKAAREWAANLNHQKLFFVASGDMSCGHPLYEEAQAQQESHNLSLASERRETWSAQSLSVKQLAIAFALAIVNHKEQA